MKSSVCSKRTIAHLFEASRSVACPQGLVSNVRVVFLDVDDVLNNEKSGYGGFVAGDQPEYYHEQIKWDQDCVDQLRMLVADTNAVIVVSSTWREDYTLEDFVKFFEIYSWRKAPVVDKTKVLWIPPTGPYDRQRPAPRSQEIVEWLDRHKDLVESFVILDDLPPRYFYDTVHYAGTPDFNRLSHAYVQTMEETGLTGTNATQARYILNLKL